MDDFVFPQAAFNPVYAPWWKVRLAKLLGTRVEGRDSGCHVVAYKWRGILYLTERDPVPRRRRKNNGNNLRS